MSLQQHQRLRTLVGLHLQDLQACLQADQPQQADSEDDHGDEHLDQRGAVLCIAG